MKIITVLKEWTLIIAMLSGIIFYFIYINIPIFDTSHHLVHEAVSVVQPILIFTMLFLTFCKIDVKHLKLKKWHLWLLLLQALFFSGLGVILIISPESTMRVLIEGAMLCLICPTATAGAVITRKLGGDVGAITTYTILINVVTAILIPMFVPFVHPHPDLEVGSAALLILGKVFPLLLCPLVAAAVVRRIWPRFISFIDRVPDLSFYIWAISLALAIAVTCHSIVNTTVDFATITGLVIISLVSCVLQFWLGRKLGGLYDDRITGGQSFGQKNTVLAIWMGYTFFTPVTAIVGGFYSIWHNIINSYQLYRHEHKISK